MDTRAIWAGVLAGAAVSGYFLHREYQQLQTAAFTRSAEQRVAASAERAVMRHLAEGYGLTQDRIASITAFANTFQPQR